MINIVKAIAWNQAKFKQKTLNYEIINQVVFKK